jgi:hypothetical protein
MKTLRERRQDPLRRFTQNSLKGRGRLISYIYCERLNLLLRSVKDLTTTTGVRRGKSKARTLSKRPEKPHSQLRSNPETQAHSLDTMQWRLIPHWTKDPLNFITLLCTCYEQIL